MISQLRRWLKPPLRRGELMKFPGCCLAVLTAGIQLAAPFSDDPFRRVDVANGDVRGAGGDQVADQGGEGHQVAADPGQVGSVPLAGRGEPGLSLVMCLFGEREPVRCPGGIGLAFPGGIFGRCGGVCQCLLCRAGRAEQLAGCCAEKLFLVLVTGLGQPGAGGLQRCAEVRLPEGPGFVTAVTLSEVTHCRGRLLAGLLEPGLGLPGG